MDEDQEPAPPDVYAVVDGDGQVTNIVVCHDPEYAKTMRWAGPFDNADPGRPRIGAVRRVDGSWAPPHPNVEVPGADDIHNP